ncbi:MAG: type I-C CRISPR-associated protein Cas8c/Csd1, partial [Phycisphaeraceae bacterium]|nr:type I-C CRISPR-associated protein Cas8c/Csd1 [Phycisphaeraceae bacterium]
MILQALHDYYQRLRDDPTVAIASFGFSVQQIGFRVVIETDGKLHAIQIIDHDKKGKPRPVAMTMPGQTKPSGSGLNPCFLWDNSAYLLGMVPAQKAKGKTGKALDKEQDRATAAFEKLREEHLAREKQIDDPGYSSVCRFLEKWDISQADGREDLLEAPNHNGVFQIRGQAGYVHDRPKIQDYWRSTLNAPVEDEKEPQQVGQCLITGEQLTLARLHEPKIKGIVGGQSVGGSLVSFNDKAYESYGNTQSYNAPVSEQATFRYCTALNHLLAQKQRRVIIGDATTVFWTEKPSPAENLWGKMFGYIEDEEQKKNIHAPLHRIANGSAPPDELGDPQTQFYVLGLSPNAARISIRYWFTGNLGQLLQRVQQHLQDLNIIGMDRPPKPGMPPSPPPMVRELLWETARDAKDIPPLLAGSLMSAILTGNRYPESFYIAVLRHIMTDGRVSARRVGILKACINRHHRILNSPMEELPVALDPDRSDVPYVLGRLFACYEKIQKDGLGE